MTAESDAANLRSLFSAAGLSRLTPVLLPLQAGSLRLKTRAVDEAKLAPGASKLGGLPDLPEGTAWPAWNGTPLGLVAQIQLADVHAYPAARELPDSGWLYFFYDGRQQAYGDKPEDRGAWQVLYAPAGPVKRQTAPAGRPDESRFKACAVDFAAEATLPKDPQVFVPKLEWQADEQDKYEDLLDKHFSARGTPRHRLLGQTDELQDDMHRQVQLLAHGVADDQDPRAAKLAAGALDWRLLLQVDSDEAAGMRWGSSGRLYFWIEKAALQKQRFDDVWMVMQSD